MGRGLSVLFLLLTISVTSHSQQFITLGATNGRAWTGMSSTARGFWLMGFFDGAKSGSAGASLLCDSPFSGSIAVENRNALPEICTLLNTHEWDLPKGLSLEDVLKGVDEFFSHPENLRFRVLDAISIFIYAPGIYAAGDVANYQDLLFAKRRRVEHWDNAVSQGQHCARVLMSERTPFRHVPYFFSDIFDLSYEYWGDSSDADEVVHRGDVSGSSFSTWWLQQSRLVAAFTMNRPDEEREAAPNWIEAKQPYRAKCWRMLRIPLAQHSTSGVMQ